MTNKIWVRNFSLLSLLVASLFVAPRLATADSFQPVLALHDPWLNDFYKTALELKTQASPVGLCASAQGSYLFNLDTQPDSIVMASRQTLDQAIANLTGSGDQFLFIIHGGPADLVANREPILHTFKSVIGSEASALPLFERLEQHAEDFANGTKVLIVNGTASYARVTTAGRPLSNDIRFFAIFDVANKQFLFVGNGDCEF